MKTQLTLLLFFTVFNLLAQHDSTVLVNDEKEITSEQYFFETSFSPHCYSSDKFPREKSPDDYFDPPKIDQSIFDGLTAYEHFVYAFYYPEWYYQSCSMFHYPEGVLQTIPAILIRQGEGLVMSQRQRLAIIQHRDSIILLMGKCIQKNGTVSNDFKRAILSLQAIELIPTLITTIQNQSGTKDPYILTLLCLLMRVEYEPFKSSVLYQQLYPSGSSPYFERAAYDRSVPFTYGNYEKIIQWAEGYYKLKSSGLSEFVQMPAGTYTVGAKGNSINPLRKVVIQPFQISRYEITNQQFNSFVENTGYITLAEKNKDAFVFKPGLDEFEWIQDSTANWKFPNGISEGSISEIMDHPVTCISYIDALAYCKWAHVRLPTIEEWEVAARANTSTRYYFGDSVNQIYKHANIWYGTTHLMVYNGEDYVTTSPVGSYAPNPFGLYDIYGNVFEFCSNTPESFKAYNNVAATRGGSWWCSISACGFFNSVDIGRVQKAASFSNNGFRVVR